MRKKIIQFCMNKIIKVNPNYSKTKLEEIKYGLEGIYMLITKLITIIIIAYIFGLLKELLLFLLFYNFIRMPSFGLHANKSWICLVFSIAIFIILPYLSTILHIPSFIKLILGIICILLMSKNAPADTHKRPIISQKRRDIYKTISVSITVIYTLGAILINNNFISNTLIFVLIIQCLMISPFVYRIFNLPYNNYKLYLSGVN